MRLRRYTAGLLAVILAGSAQAGPIREYLTSARAGAESERSRQVLEGLASDLEDLAAAAPARYCGTPLAQDLFEARDELTAEAHRVVSAELAGALARPALTLTFDAPDAPFRIHYDTSGSNAVLNPRDTAADGVPVYVHVAADALTLAYHLLIDSLGWAPPLSDSLAGGGLHLYDCYLAYPSGQSFIIALTVAETAYGKIVGNDTIVVATSYQVVHPTMDPFPQLADPLDLLRITCAHEFLHAFHFSLDAFEKPSWQRAGWWLEGTAVWFEDFAFPDINDWSNLPAYFDEPWRSITSSSVLSDLHPYGGGSVWSFYLVERFGGPDILRLIWNRCGLVPGDNTLAAIDAQLQAAGSGFDAAWHEFSRRSMRTGRRWDDSSFEQGASWPEARPTYTVASYPQAVYFTDGSDGLGLLIGADTPVLTIDSTGTPLEALGFAPVGHLTIPSFRPDSNMRVFVTMPDGLPVEFSWTAIDTSLAPPRIVAGHLLDGDTTLITRWTDLQSFWVTASAAEYYAGGSGQFSGDSLGRVTPWLTIAVDYANPPVTFVPPFPNPVSSGQGDVANFRVVVPAPAEVWLDIFSVSGDRVASLQMVGDAWPPITLVWDGRNAAGGEVASGLYLCKLTARITGSGEQFEQVYRLGVVR